MPQGKALIPRHLRALERATKVSGLSPNQMMPGKLPEEVSCATRLRLLAAVRTGRVHAWEAKTDSQRVGRPHVW